VCGCCRLVVLLISRVTNELHPPYHLSHSEESQNLRPNYTRRDHLLSTEIPNPAQKSFWRIGGSDVNALVEHASRITDDVDKRLRIFLKSSKITVTALSVWKAASGVYLCKRPDLRRAHLLTSEDHL